MATYKIYWGSVAAGAPPAGWANITKASGSVTSDLAKIPYGITKTDIAKVCGVPV